jgi:hypothetical protein
MERALPVDPKPKLTDAERHQRFKDMAREVEASEESADFDRAFGAVAAPPEASKEPDGG